MKSESSPNDLFRFVQFRPPVSIASNNLIPLIPSTELFQELQAATTITARQSIADIYISEAVFIRLPDQLQYGASFQSALNTTSEANEPSIELFLTTLLELLEVSDVSELVNNSAFQTDIAHLSDALLARLYTTKLLSNLSILQHIYRLYHLVIRIASDEEIALSWDQLLRISIVIPDETMDSIITIRRAQGSISTSTDFNAQQDKSAVDLVDRRSELYDAYKELLKYDYNQYLIQPESDEANEEASIIFGFKPKTIEMLSTETKNVLEDLLIDVENTPIHTMIITVYASFQQEDIVVGSAMVNAGLTGFVAQGVQIDDLALTRRDIRPSGVGNLQVVKQQIKRYEPTEIAHIENILSGETKSREHRQLQQIEETFTSVFETTREEQNELQTTQRFELKQETSRTLEQDQNVKFGVKLSGKYGPVVDFTSNFELETSESVKETNNNASNYAQDIVERSLEKIVENVREERVRRILREVEEKNLHELKNDNPDHIRGVYQFVDKIYQAQVFDYGIRMMYDFIIPEPASYLHYLRDQPDQEFELPDPPIEFALTSHKSVNESNYGIYVSRYGATDIEPPPAPYVLASAIFNNEGDGEGGVPKLAKTEKLTIPDGYGPERVEYAAQATTDDDMNISVLIGSRFSQISRSSNTNFPPFPIRLSLGSGSYSYPQSTQLSIGVFSFESRNFIVDITVICKRRPEHYEQWQLKTFQKIQQAYEKRLLEYEDEVARIKAEEALAQAEDNEETSFDSPPSLNRVIERNELKKHTISIVTGSRYEYINATIDGSPPYFNFDEAREEGSLIRFFEQVFEWEQMQYIFYPYFWGRTSTWDHRFLVDNADPQFREFLKSGAARVVVPVRPGFETALQHYLDTGKVWDGQGDPPEITNPLYVSIIDEIKERTGASQGEISVGEPWEIRVPTNLLYVRENDDLPEWVENPPGSWQWTPSTSSDNENGMSVARLTLVNAQTDEEVFELLDGVELDLAKLPPINIRAYTNPPIVGSVTFQLDGAHSSRDDFPPYKLVQGEREGEFIPRWVPRAGITHTIEAIPRSEIDDDGFSQTGKSLAVTVKIVDSQP